MRLKLNLSWSWRRGELALFMGAGFSARFGYPVMNRFFDVAERTAVEDGVFRQSAG